MVRKLDLVMACFDPCENCPAAMLSDDERRAVSRLLDKHFDSFYNQFSGEPITDDETPSWLYEEASLALEYTRPDHNNAARAVLAAARTIVRNECLSL